MQIDVFIVAGSYELVQIQLRKLFTVSLFTYGKLFVKKGVQKDRRQKLSLTFFRRKYFRGS
jgi:hypothetical protein